MYDLHCHILYGVDDGADTLRESVEMAQLAFEGGTKVIVATPHCNIPGTNQNLWEDNLKSRFYEVKKAVEKAGIPIEFLPGQEIFCQAGTLELLKSGKIITLNNSRYPLVEFKFEESGEMVIAKLKKLMSEGYVPVIAHPERYKFIAKDFDSLVKIKKLGCIIQVNKGSFKGTFGRTAQTLAYNMLESQMVDVVASDGHGPFVRTPFMSDIHEIISEMYTTDYADLLLMENPKAILDNKTVLTY